MLDVVRWSDIPESRDPKNLGNVLLRLRLVTADQLRLGVITHRREKKMLGEALVALGFITPELLEHALLVQQAERENSPTRMLSSLDRLTDAIRASTRRLGGSLDELELMAPAPVASRR